jgi:CO/xanthine dehydrogenase Mo-binding subunit
MPPIRVTRTVNGRARQVEPTLIGASPIRKDAGAKVTGTAQYAADIPAANLRHAAVLRSPHDHAAILRIDTGPARALSGVRAVITADDVPGSLIYGPLVQDRPALAQYVVRHIGEPVAIVVANTRQAAEAALAAMIVEYAPLPAVFDPRAALAPDAPLVHPGGNLVSEYDVGDGDLDAGFAAADVIIEQAFTVPRISPAYLETEAALAEWHKDGTLTVWVSSQKPFQDRATIAEVLGLEADKVQVRLAVVGGAFGGKEDSEQAVLASLAAWVSRSTVRLANSRRESFVGHPKRHPGHLRLRLGARHDGTLVALDAEVHLDVGAYASYGPAVGSLLTEVVPGAYRIPNVRVHTRVVYTDSPLSGAMRGFGSPQAHFALESLLDMLAVRLGLDPLALRERNILRPGDRLFTRVIVGNTALSLPETLAHVAATRERLGEIPAAPGKVSGVGFALCAQSMGLGHRVPDDSTQRLEWLPDGRVQLYIGAPELGQGLVTAAEQFVAEALGLPFEVVQTYNLDTSVSPDGGVACASRMTYLVGNSVTMASQALIDCLLDFAARSLGVAREALAYAAGHVTLPDGGRVPAAEFAARAADEGQPLQATATASFPYPANTTPGHLPIGMPHVMFCYGAQVARVEVDPELGTVEVTDIVAIHDVGQIVNRAGVEGQIEGGVVMGLGYALYEDVQRKPGGQWVDSFSEYLLPTARDVPARIESIILEVPELTGPHGAKGIAEMPVVPTAPAIANAVYTATGVRVTSLPIRAEAIAGRAN